MACHCPSDTSPNSVSFSQTQLELVLHRVLPLLMLSCVPKDHIFKFHELIQLLPSLFGFLSLKLKFNLEKNLSESNVFTWFKDHNIKKYSWRMVFNENGTYFYSLYYTVLSPFSLHEFLM